MEYQAEFKAITTATDILLSHQKEKACITRMCSPEQCDAQFKLGCFGMRWKILFYIWKEKVVNKNLNMYL